MTYSDHRGCDAYSHTITTPVKRPPKNTDAPESAPGGAARSGPRTEITLVPSDPSWSHWLAWMTDNDHRSLRVAAEEARQMVVASRWPRDASPVPRVDHGPAISARMSGEIAE